MTIDFIKTTNQLFHYYKDLADKSISQLSDSDIHLQQNETSNNVYILIKHISGNLKSRFTDFYISDGEKPDRNRESEFEDNQISKNNLIIDWEKSWQILFDLMDSMKDSDLSRIIYIRNEGHTVLQALQRQLAHYSYHVGQIVYLAKHIKNENWLYLSVAPGKTDSYNEKKFNKEKSEGFFTENMENEK